MEQQKPYTYEELAHLLDKEERDQIVADELMIDLMIRKTGNMGMSEMLPYVGTVQRTVPKKAKEFRRPTYRGRRKRHG